MKITSMEIHPDNSSNVKVFSFKDPRRENPYNIKAIVGLDADEIIPKFYGGSENSKFYNLSLAKREIVVRVELNPRYNLDETPSSLRDDLSKLIASSRRGLLQLHFKDGETVKAAIRGFVKKFESSLFSKIPEVQITIKCDEPMLTALDRTEIDVVGLSSALVNIPDVDSTAPHGFTFEMEVTADIEDLLIYDPGDTEWAFGIAPIGGFLAGDVIHFSSEYNNKYLYLIREENLFHLADAIVPGSIWPIIFPDSNVFAFTNAESLSWRAISFLAAYWGV